MSSSVPYLGHRLVRCALVGDQRWTDSHLAAAPRGIAASALFGASALCGLPPPISTLSLPPPPRRSLWSTLFLPSIPPSLSLSLSLAVPLVYPRAAHIRASWGGMVYHAVQPPFRRSLVGFPSSSRCYSACQHRRRRENRYYGEINMIGRRMPRYPYTSTLRAPLSLSAFSHAITVLLFPPLSPSPSFDFPL